MALNLPGVRAAAEFDLTQARRQAAEWQALIAQMGQAAAQAPTPKLALDLTGIQQQTQAVTQAAQQQTAAVAQAAAQATAAQAAAQTKAEAQRASAQARADAAREVAQERADARLAAAHQRALERQNAQDVAASKKAQAEFDKTLAARTGQPSGLAASLADALKGANLTPKLDDAPIRAQITGLKGFIEQAFKSFGGPSAAVPGIGGLLGITGAGTLAAGVGLGAAALVELGKEARSARRELANLTGATGEELAGLVEGFHRLAGGVPESGTAVVQVMATLRQQLGGGSEALGVTTQAVLALGRVLGGDLTERAVQAAGVLKAFNVAADAQRDTLGAFARVVQTTGIGFGELTDILRSGAPLFQAVGLNEREAAVFLGQLQRAGVDAGQAMFALRAGLGRAAEAGTDARQQFAALFSAIKNAPSDTEAVALAMQNFGARGGAALAKGIRDGTLSLEGLREAAGTLDSALESPFAKGETAGDRFKAKLNELKEAMLPVAEGAAGVGVAFLGTLNDMGAGIDVFLASDRVRQFLQIVLRGGAGAGTAAATLAGAAPPTEAPPAPAPAPLAAPVDRSPLAGAPRPEDLQAIKEGTLAISDLVTQQQAERQTAAETRQAIEGQTDATRIQAKADQEAAERNAAYVESLKALAVAAALGGKGLDDLIKGAQGNEAVLQFLFTLTEQTKVVDRAITELTDKALAAQIAQLRGTAQATGDLGEKQRILAEAATLAKTSLSAQQADVAVLGQRYQALTSAVLPLLTAEQQKFLKVLEQSGPNGPAQAASAALALIGGSAAEAGRALQGTGVDFTQYVEGLQRIVATADPVANAHRKIEESAKTALQSVLAGLPVADQAWAAYRAAREGDAAVLTDLASHFGIDPDKIKATLAQGGQAVADLQAQLQRIATTADPVANANKAIEASAKSLLDTLSAGLPAADRAWLQYVAARQGDQATLRAVYAAMGGDLAAFDSATEQQQKRLIDSLARARAAFEEFVSTGRVAPAAAPPPDAREDFTKGTQQATDAFEKSRRQWETAMAKAEEDYAHALVQFAQAQAKADREFAATIAKINETLAQAQAEADKASAAVDIGLRTKLSGLADDLDKLNAAFARSQADQARQQAQQLDDLLRNYQRAVEDAQRQINQTITSGVEAQRQALIQLGTQLSGLQQQALQNAAQASQQQDALRQKALQPGQTQQTVSEQAVQRIQLEAQIGLAQRAAAEQENALKVAFREQTEAQRRQIAEQTSQIVGGLDRQRGDVERQVAEAHANAARQLEEAQRQHDEQVAAIFEQAAQAREDAQAQFAAIEKRREDAAKQAKKALDEAKAQHQETQERLNEQLTHAEIQHTDTVANLQLQRAEQEHQFFDTIGRLEKQFQASLDQLEVGRQSYAALQDISEKLNKRNVAVTNDFTGNTIVEPSTELLQRGEAQIARLLAAPL